MTEAGASCTPSVKVSIKPLLDKLSFLKKGKGDRRQVMRTSIRKLDASDAVQILRAMQEASTATGNSQ